MITFAKLGLVKENDTTGCLLDYNCFNKYYKIMAIDLIKQLEVGLDLEAIHQTRFTWNLN